MPKKKEKLPPGWLKRESKSYPGKFYYFHKTTGRTTWLLPTDEKPFQIKKTESKESKSSDACTSKSSAKISQKSLSAKEKRETMFPRAVRQTCTAGPSICGRKKILNVSVLNRNNCSLVADYSSCSDDEELSKAKKKKEKDENENKIKKANLILPAITERDKVQMKWKPVGSKIPKPSSKLVLKEEQKTDSKDTVYSPTLKKPKSHKKKVKSKKSCQQDKEVKPSSKLSSESVGSENSCFEVPQNQTTTKRVDKNDKSIEDFAKNHKEEPVTSEKSIESKLSSKKHKGKRKQKKKCETSLESPNLNKTFDSTKLSNCPLDVPFVQSEQFLPFQPVAPEIKNSNLVPVFGENDMPFNNKNISASDSFHVPDNYLHHIEDSSQPMEVDNTFGSDMVNYIVKLRKDMSSEPFNTVTGDLTKHFEMDTSNSIDHTAQPQVTYVVLDTNTLVNAGDLAVIKYICDGKHTDECHLPYIIIPWVVMQELDVLKSRSKQKPDTAERAQRAIVFLSSYFTKKHPRVIGQTLKEAMQQNEYLVAENNDDKILQCCMQLESKYPNGKVILYSNDVNLCNKTLINGISAFNKTAICSALSKWSGITADNCDQKRCVSYSQESIKEATCSRKIDVYHNDISQIKKVAPQLNLVNQISKKLKEILKGVLGLILETEMKAAFNEMWLKIIKVQPPWELINILYCFVEHWYAVFGQVYTKNRNLMKSKYKNLLEYSSSKKELTDSKNVSLRLEDSSFVLEPLLTVNPVYKAEIKCSLESIEILQQICTASLAGEVDINSNLEELLEQQSSAKEELPTKNCLDSPMVPEPSLSTDFAMSIALTKFQKVWEIFNSYCQEVERALQSGASPETCQQVLVTLQTSIPMMEITYNQFSSCLGLSAVDIPKEVNMFTVLAEQLNAILPQLGCQDNNPLVNCVHLQTLFSNPEKQEMLTNGLAQLEVMIRGLHTYQGHLVGT